MPTYLQSILNGDTADVTYDCIEFSHPAFSETYYVVSNAVDGVTVTHEDATVHEYKYIPVDLKRSNSSDDLDQTLSISVADFGGELAALMYAAALAGDQRPKVKYRAYSSNDLTAPMLTLQALEVHSYKRDSNGNAQLDAKAQQLNVNKTGEVYSLERFPLLAALL